MASGTGIPALLDMTLRRFFDIYEAIAAVLHSRRATERKH